MRIACLDPFLTETVCYFELKDSLVGISAECDHPADIVSRPRLTRPEPGHSVLEQALGGKAIDRVQVAAVNPDIVLARVVPQVFESDRARQQLEELWQRETGTQSRLHLCCPRRLDEIYEVQEELGKVLKVPHMGHRLASRVKAQVMDWGDSFYDRMHRKKVTFVCSVSPLKLAGLWFPDLIHLCSAQSQVRLAGAPHMPVRWTDILEYKPDVMVIAPEGASLQESMAAFKELERLPGWEAVPAVKRGEVTFSAGNAEFYRPGPRIFESIGVLVSAIAGLDSGYITPRDSFYRLRWLELQRHRL